MPRLFVALSIPESIADALAPLQNGVEGARWRPLENFHLSLAFIGETDRHGFDAALDAMTTIDAPPIELKISGLGYFGDKRPRALWAGVETAPNLIHLQAKIESALRRKDFEFERPQIHAPCYAGLFERRTPQRCRRLLCGQRIICHRKISGRGVSPLFIASWRRGQSL